VKRKIEMKALRALLLVLALSVCANADGNMGSGIATPPPPPNPPASATAAPGTGDDTITGQMQTGVVETDPVTEITLTLLQSLLSII
jgi:hypothetical protein